MASFLSRPHRVKCISNSIEQMKYRITFLECFVILKTQSQGSYGYQ